MFDDDKIKLIESLPDGDSILVIWVKLLTQAGRTNANGYIFLNENIPYTDEMLATIFNRPLNTVRLALATFQRFGMIEWDETGILILNWEKHQNIDGLEKLREQNKERASKYRKRLSAVGGNNYLEHYNEVYKRDGGKCVYCGSTDLLCLDHLVPLSKGGDNEKDNLVIACKACNSGKGGRMIEESKYSFRSPETLSQYASVKHRLKITQSITQHHATELELELEEEKEYINTNTYCQDSNESLTTDEKNINVPLEIPSQKPLPLTVKKSKYQQEAEELIEYYNSLKGHHPIKATENNTADIIRRLKEGNEVEACKALIFYKKQALKDEMEMYWTPISMFRKSNFYRFLESVKFKLQNEDFRKSLDISR